MEITRKMKNYTAGFLFAALLGFSSQAFALPFINEGFELGNLTGWTALGDVEVVSSYTSASQFAINGFDINPPDYSYLLPGVDGHFFARLDDGYEVDDDGFRTNSSTDTSGFPFPDPAPGSLAPTIPEGFDGAILSRPLHLDPGESLQFNWAFLNFDGEADSNDFALFALDTGGLADGIDEIHWLMDGFTVDTNQGFSPADTGWKLFTFDAPAGGFDGTAYWVVTNGNTEGFDPDEFQPSVLLVDTVPEPSSFLLFGIGMVGFAWRFSSRNDRQQRAMLSPC